MGHIAILLHGSPLYAGEKTVPGEDQFSEPTQRSRQSFAVFLILTVGSQSLLGTNVCGQREEVGES